MNKLLSLSTLSFLLSGCSLWPPYAVWESQKAGEAEYAKAESTRKIKILEAEAAEESAKALAKAEVARAEGVAQANKIIGDSLKGNDAYLRYLWINNLEKSDQKEVVYIPTEAGLPILEAGKANSK